MTEPKAILKTVFRHRCLKAVLAIVLLSAAIYLLIPKPDLYEKYNFSAAVYDRSGRLLKLSLSMDDKYRLFTPLKNIPQEAVQALLLYEDRSFYRHPGVNPLSVVRAVYEMASGGRKQGASTITMQVARIVFRIDSSTLSGKIVQMLRALQIELFYSKDEILEAYFNLAPYGGNIEGLGAAARIYFDKPVQNLNLPQIMALTVIPQNPGKRHLLSEEGRSLSAKAAARLKETWLKSYRHRENSYLSLPLASGVFLPKEAPHFVRAVLRNRHGEVKTTLDLDYQHMTENILRGFVAEHKKDGVYNAAALIVDARTMDTLAYVGSYDFGNEAVSGQVDGTGALRSPGSALKPFIYAMALDRGIIHPMTMLKDVPKQYGVYTPENFDRSFYGLVNATEALVHSRNIPAVDLLLKVGEKDFYRFLRQCRVPDLRPAEFYGLAMALGGTEVSMQNLAAMYAMLYNGGDFRPLRLLPDETSGSEKLLSPEAAFLTLSMLAENKAIDDSRTSFSAKRENYPVSWKTGTSYGYKDAWSAGVVGSYVVIVWVGNFDGTPNHAFVGRSMAAPLFFRIVRKIARQNAIPTELKPKKSLNLAKVKICRDTGDIANAYCDRTTETLFIPGVSNIRFSDVSRLIPIDVKTGLRACRHTPPDTEMKSFNFWPSDVLQAYEKAGISVRRPPAFKESCEKVDTFGQGRAPQIVSPADGSRFLLNLRENKKEKIALNAVLDADAENVYWFVNNLFSGQTKAGEVLEVQPRPGINKIRAVDDRGRSSVVSVEIVF